LSMVFGSSGAPAEIATSTNPSFPPGGKGRSKTS
jgi:hypothetical protein